MAETKFPKLFAIDIDKMEAVRTDDDHKWGWEKWLVNDAELGLCCKLLIIYPGWRSSKHVHETKAEYFQVLSGELKLVVYQQEDHQVVDKIIHMEAGSQHFIPENTYHSFETNTKQFVLLLEVSTFEDEQTEKELPSERLY